MWRAKTPALPSAAQHMYHLGKHRSFQSRSAHLLKSLGWPAGFIQMLLLSLCTPFSMKVVSGTLNLVYLAWHRSLTELWGCPVHPTFCSCVGLCWTVGWSGSDPWPLEYCRCYCWRVWMPTPKAYRPEKGRRDHPLPAKAALQTKKNCQIDSSTLRVFRNVLIKIP